MTRNVIDANFCGDADGCGGHAYKSKETLCIFKFILSPSMKESNERIYNHYIIFIIQ